MIISLKEKIDFFLKNILQANKHNKTNNPFCLQMTDNAKPKNIYKFFCLIKNQELIFQ